MSFPTFDWNEGDEAFLDLIPDHLLQDPSDSGQAFDGKWNVSVLLRITC